MIDALTSKVHTILKDQFDLENVAVQWQRPQENDHGDTASAIALQIAKKVQKSPQDIAKIIAEGLGDVEGVEKVDIAGPGYVNVWMTPEALLKALNASRTACTQKVTRKDEAPVIVEYSQPNIAKPLGIHHVMSTVMGQAISNLYRHQGYNVLSINHIGDWGTQFGKLAIALEKWGTKPVSECSLDELLELYVRFHEEVESDESLDDQAREAFRKLENGDAELREFWESVVGITMNAMGAIYERLHVSFDHVQGESFYEDKMTPVVEEGKEKSIFKEGDKGALIAEFPEETKLPPAIVLKGDGATIYLTRDLATIKYRMDEWHPQSILYVVDVAQELYFKQLFGVVDQLEWDLPTLEHVVIGRMRFADKSMSTRKGNILKLEEVLNEGVERAKKVIDDHGDSIQTDDVQSLSEMMGIGSVVYGVLSQNRKMGLVFDWEKMLSFDGNSAPYIQYTHARACSILRKAEIESVDIPESVEGFEEKERSLLNTLLQFEDTLEEARAAHMPHLLTNYLFKLCQEFNGFYNDVPILKAEGVTRQLRLALSASVANVLKTGAEILTLRVPDRM